MSVDKIVDTFIKNFNTKAKIFFSPMSFRSTSRNCSKNTHSLLQYLLIKAGIDSGYMAIPEVKIEFSEKKKKNNKNNCSFKKRIKNVFEDKNINIKNRTFKKVDVGFAEIDENNKILKFVGFGEIYTIDGAFHCLETEKVAEKISDEKELKDWILARDLLIHLVECYKDCIKYRANRTLKPYMNFDLKFAILIVVLPKKADIVSKSQLEKLNLKKKVKEIKELFKYNGNYYKAFKKSWKDLRDKLTSKNLDCRLLVITEENESSDKFIVKPYYDK